MPNILKHVGKHGQKPCVVVFREVPDEPENCLIVETETLDDKSHNDLMDVVQSTEAQQSSNLSDVLHRRQFTTGDNMLSALHYGKKMRKVPVSQVMLVPLPNQEVSLSEVNAELRKIAGGYEPPKTDPAHLVKDGATLETDPSLNQQRVAVSENQTDNGSDPVDVARGLLAQAELLKLDAEALQQDADAKLAEAYKLNPSLKPTASKKKTAKKTAVKK